MRLATIIIDYRLAITTKYLGIKTDVPANKIALVHLRSTVAAVPVVASFRAEDTFSPGITYLQSVVSHVLDNMGLLLISPSRSDCFTSTCQFPFFRYEPCIGAVLAALSGIRAAVGLMLQTRLHIAQGQGLACEIIIRCPANEQLRFIVGFAKRRRFFTVR